MAKPSKLDSSKEAFLSLVRLGIGKSVDSLPEKADWETVETLASEQGLLAVMADGIEQLHIDGRSPKKSEKAASVHWFGDAGCGLKGRGYIALR